MKALALVLALDYAAYMISSSGNAPSVPMSAGIYPRICVALHEGKSPAQIATDLRIEPSALRANLDALQHEGLIKRLSSGRYVPAFLIVSRREGTWLASVAPGAARETARAIERRSDRFFGAFEKIGSVRKGIPQELTLLLYSDVLLDNWQIRKVEAQFVRVPRPLRNGKRYYFGLFERSPQEGVEPFGIYGNQVYGLGENFAVSVYGNHRNGRNLLTAYNEQSIASMAGAYVAYARLGTSMEPGIEKRFEGLDLIRNGRALAPVFGEKDDAALDEIAGSFTPDLVAILNKHGAELAAAYRRSPYAHEVTLPEFELWWYHFFYSSVTDRLVADGYIRVPVSGVVTYFERE